MFFVGRNFPWIEANLGASYYTHLRKNNERVMAIASLWSNLERVNFNGSWCDLSTDDFIPKFKSLLASGCWSKV
jgi:hypothetical protein